MAELNTPRLMDVTRTILKVYRTQLPLRENYKINITIKELMATTVKDLVCGMDIDPATAAGKLIKGRHIISVHWREGFRREP